MNKKPFHNPTLDRQLISSLVYLTVTRPNLFFVVSLISQFKPAPHTVHYYVALCILQYIKTCYGLWLSSIPTFHLHSYSNVDWVGLEIVMNAILLWVIVFSLEIH